MTSASRSSAPYFLTGLLWLGLAGAAAASGQLAQDRPPAPQVVLLGLTVALIISGVAAHGFHEWLDSICLRSLLRVIDHGRALGRANPNANVDQQLEAGLKAGRIRM